MPTRPLGSPTLDLTLAGSFGNIDDLVFETSQAQPAGTGTFQSVTRTNGPENPSSTRSSDPSCSS